MSDPLGETLGTTAGPDDRAGTAEPAAELIRAFECDQPAVLPARFRLTGVHRVDLGRGAERCHERIDDAGVLRIHVPDRWMSSRHAHVRNSFGRWILEDAGSKNGSHVNGETVSRRELHDGDLIELGHTLFIFRSQVVRDDGPADVDLAAGPPPEPGLTTLVPELERELAKLVRLARSEVPVLLLGESGTGKEVLAHAFHRRSARAGELVAVNCGAIPETLVESELFGHKKGAFSGAVADSAGLVRAADGGTLFLDEIADLPPPSQAALLRVLQEREVRPVGGTRSVPVDIRLVSATHRDLPALVEAGAFRQDLYARISGFRIRVPRLAERRADLGLLIGTLLSRLAPDAPPEIDVDVARCFFSYDWPRNIRELETTLRAALVLSSGGRIVLDHLPEDLRADLVLQPHDDAPPLSDDDLARRDELVALLRAHAGNISAVSRAVGKDRKQVHRWLKRFGLHPDEFRS